MSLTSITPCAKCGLCHTSADCPTQEQVLAQTEDLLKSLPASYVGLTPRQAWNMFFCPPPGQQDQSARLAASAWVDQEGGAQLGLSVKGLPAPANCLDQFLRVDGISRLLEQFSLASKSGDRQFSVLAGNALQLFSNELAKVDGDFNGNKSCLLERDHRSLVDGVFIAYGRSFVLLVHELSSVESGNYTTFGL